MTNKKNTCGKTEMISNLTIALKEKGFRKKRAYWYKGLEEYLVCVNVQGSQWDSNNYYINIGMAKKQDEKEPTLLEWIWRHRCKGTEGELNISLDEVILCIEKYVSDFQLDNDISAFLKRNNATIVGQQYWL